MSPRFAPLALAMVLVVAPAWGPEPLEAQDGAADPGEWNAPAALDLVDRGRTARATLAEDDELETYRALTEGHVYFFLDPEVGERSLIRVDQVAVEVDWEAPGRVRQHIVGERSETRLPVREFDYYLDRVSLVPYGFGDEIRIGSGMDVSGVPHPLGPDDHAYDYRLADSLSLHFPGREEPVRLYELDVRPRDEDRPGILGTLTLDAASAQVVRMAFTFTPSSYVDPRTDWISAELEYGLWEDRYWLPNVQRIEVRRELPEIDLGVGTVIRSVLRTGSYELNVPVDRPVAGVGSVSRAPPETRASYPFREGLYEALDRDGLTDLPVDSNVRRLRSEALERTGRAPPSALSSLRLHLPGPSSLLRYSRSEGLVPGVGASLRASPSARARALVGYAVGADHLRGELDLEAGLSRSVTLEADLRHRTTDDLGLAPASDPLVSSLGTLLRGEDYRDPFNRTGASVGLTHRRDGSVRLALRGGVDRIESARRVVEHAPVGERVPRPVRPVEDGTFGHLELDGRAALDVPAEGRARLDATTRLLSGRPGRGIGLDLKGNARWGPPQGVWDVHLDIRGWRWWGDALPQGHRLLGGRGTVPGQPFRAFAGQRAAAASLQAAADAGTSLLRIRAGLHGGWADELDPATATAWDVDRTGSVRAAASLGIGFPWDLVRLDVARGLNGGDWQVLLTVDPAWWDRL